jgi:hypothetical protein
MYGTGIGTSLMLIAIGAVLAFAVNIQTSGIDLNTIGVILIVVGLIGLLLSFMMLGDFGSYFGRRSTDRQVYYQETTPHEHGTAPGPHDAHGSVSRVEREERTVHH